MDYHMIERNDRKYIRLNGTGRPICTERDAAELVVICWENGANLLLIPDESLSDEFLRLSTGVAGAVLQKFAMYNIRAAAMIEEGRIKGRFKEFLSESNHGNVFRAYGSYEEAEQWLLSDRH